MADVANDSDEAESRNYSFNLLVDLPEISEYVLKKLPMKSLNTCARVCKSWNEQVKRIKKHRKQPSWFMSTIPYHLEDFGKLFHEQFSKAVQNLSSEPNIAMFFCCTPVFEKPVAVPSSVVKPNHRRNSTQRATKLYKQNVMDYVKTMLPDECMLLGLTTEGIIGTTPDNSISVEMESADAGSILLLPKTDAVEFYPIHLYQDNVVLNTRDDIEEHLGIPKDKNVKALLIFYVVDGVMNPRTDNLIITFMNIYDDIVISGGYVDNILLQNEPLYELMHQLSWVGCLEEDYCIGLALCGDHLSVSSCRLTETIKSPAAAETCIKQLYDSHKLRTFNLGFQFACIGRGWHHYRSQNVEANLFKKYFPTVPLHGFFGNGEIGHDHFHQSSENVKKDKKLGKKCKIGSLLHSYNTIMTVISWGETL
ncbi:F-box only protein 22-like [Tubulanus polymorphus]|uniref:F-box only protein 22-like n=1 Tax=Tubulanus polymorphus TaxID=672921 RepID=UPI003DA2C3E2